MNAETKVTRMFAWDGTRFQTGHQPPRDAILFAGTSHSGKRRVQIFGDYQAECKRQNVDYNWSTIWHYDEDGTLDGAGPEWALQAA